MSPARAPDFEDSGLTRTFILVEHEAPPFAQAFRAMSPDVSDGDWMVVLSQSGKAYMAASSPNALFLFGNPKYGCVHSAPSFGDIEPGSQVTVRSRIYLAQGSMDDFVRLYEADQKVR